MIRNPAPKLRMLGWFLQRPSHWAHLTELGKRKFRAKRDTTTIRAQARSWASEHSVSLEESLEAVGLLFADRASIPRLPEKLLEEAEKRVRASGVTMGGPGDIRLLYAAVLLSGARRVVETGVAYGWSSLAILAAQSLLENTKLVSVDMPYPGKEFEKHVGIAVPTELKANWTIIRKPDRNGLKEALLLSGSQVDLCHYDSDKSWWGRHFAFPLVWKTLRPGGILISDDIQDNLYFSEFVSEAKLEFAVTEFEGKYVGLCRKPA